MAILSYPRDVLEDNVRSFVGLGSEIDPKYVVPAVPTPATSKSDVAPNVIFATVQLIEDVRYGVPAEYKTHNAEDGNIWVTVRSDRVATYSVQWYRKGASIAAQTFIEWADSSIGQLAQLRRNFQIDSRLGLINYGRIRSLDALISDDWEERVGIDLSIGYYLDSSYNTGRIERLDGNLMNVDGKILDLDARVPGSGEN